MKKFLTAFCLLAAFSAPAQTLFTYGKDAVSAGEFLAAFQKNNKASDEKAMREYLDLYIASRLKIKEAKEKGYDTLPQLIGDLANLRQQILPTYLNDKESLDRLVAEAFLRSQKDVQVAHIFISWVRSGKTDTAAAKARLADVSAKLAKGVKFEELAKEYSDDPSAKTNGGNIGWITVFSLPYQLENFIYTTPVGKTSSVYTSRAGYHLFKNLGERKAFGTMKAAQILLAIPPGADDKVKAKLKKTADSLYSRLQAGADFGKLATAFSNDVISAASKGEMSEFGVGEFDPAFENAAFSLKKDGAITKPFLTAHGYHIVKRLKLIPVTDKRDDEVIEGLRRKVESSDRILTTQKIIAGKVLEKAGYQKLWLTDNELWAFSDSVFSNIQPRVKLTVSAATPVIKLGMKTFTVQDWIGYAQTARFNQNGSGVKPYPVLWSDFIEAAALQYYQDHLEDFNEDFRRQITEFAEGNLFFEIMQRQVWTPAQSDTASLEKFYQQNRSRYHWKESADAVLFYGTDKAAAESFYKAVQKSPAGWKVLLNKYAEQMTADSNRFELAQIPKAEKERLAAGKLTTLSENKADNTVSFAYIIRLHNGGEPRNFVDARGLVINDYQAYLENEWIAELKKKYPVSIDESVWKVLLKKAGNGDR